ncbi:MULTISPECIES: bifunctional 2-polyprenyl-6-hydroxyphenol methylase/3-demethylubiquinol 3-O-methyltransferase UbiG [Rhodomicrobium]|uniref:bifunctional 2-polyprenyl-6-hydroxyphenol methylase/3-demethylubiquinol 3-O-methyltransferase UbiG n=1 Tax=Rhodomicrobium TaxID=1068 RepID=UPI000B4ADE69|nr:MULTISPECIES: bifunctional 2-polyprenyl-6-hydroxyphenol methylase/3-demethylubiquinol 3-O-methyltransferase UbiG [Rhodomicrobium]
MNIVDNDEVERFAAMAGDWWNPTGKFRPLHQLGPARLAFIRDEVVAHLRREPRPAKILADLRVLDVGCGGGLVAEPLARLGAAVTGIDPAAENIAVARAHAEAQGLAIDYRAATTQDLAAGGERFDCVVAMEVVEHVPDVPEFLRSCAALMRPGGLLLVSTLNRTAKSYALGIVAAEYLLGWLPRGTHQWQRFVTPEELRGMFRDAGLEPIRERGMSYDPLRARWDLTDDCDVNYLSSAGRPVA